jgi:hypothetical protein
MNARIKELAEQAMVSISYRVCQNTFKEIEDPAGPFIRKEFSKEKFAELIVKECAEQCSKALVKHTGQPSVTHNYAVGLCQDRIKEHFGVEE